MKKPVFVILLIFHCLITGSQQLSSDVCVTPTCNDTASQILKWMDPSVEPCDDFYKFACGGILNSTEFTDDFNEINSIMSTNNNFHDKIKMTLEEDISIDEFNYLKLAKTLYTVCTDEEYDIHIDSMEASGGWPILKRSKWNKNAFNFKKTIFKVGDTTQWKNYFFEFSLSIDYTSIIVEPYPSDLSVEDFVEGRNNTNVINYYNNMINVVINEHAWAFNTKYRKDLNEIINFEIELGRSRLSTEQKLDPTFDKVEMTLKELTNNYSFFNWNEYINYLHGSPVDLSTNIIINNFNYMKKLSSLVNSTNKKTLANYIMWKHVENNKNNYNSLESKSCVDVVMEKLPIAIGAIYIQNYNNSMIIAKNNIEKMISNIKEKYFKIIEEADWIDNKTKNKITREIKLSIYEIGYINEFINSSKIVEYYNNLELFEDEEYYDAIARIDLFNQNKKLTYNNENIWTFFGSKMLVEIYPFFVYSSNSIVIPYILLKSNIFDSEKPNYMNYGALGYMIGHEISHIFDITSKNNGILLNDFWTKYSKDNFHNKSKCIIEQYDNYTLFENGPKLNGAISQSENIADNNGIKVAYRAYKELSNTDEIIDGLKYTSKQLFWISYANSLREKTTLSIMQLNIAQEHLPFKYRVIGSLSNIVEFADDFKCPLGSKMNPIKKCSVL